MSNEFSLLNVLEQRSKKRTNTQIDKSQKLFFIGYKDFCRAKIELSFYKSIKKINQETMVCIAKGKSFSQRLKRKLKLFSEIYSLE